ncbi:MAG: hypothetical protein IJR61_04985 [Clostridia bacterium]|nr:hypothetical protein [Clostridia bacterium]
MKGLVKKIAAAAAALTAFILVSCGARNDTSSIVDDSSSSAESFGEEFSAEEGKPDDIVIDFDSPSGNIPDPLAVSFSAVMPAFFADKNNEITVEYGPTYFAGPSYGFSRNIAMLSLAMAWANLSESKIKKFTENGPFEDAVFKSFRSENVTDSISYTIARICESDFDVIAVSVRGYDYADEWIGNFDIGTEGYHRGFKAAADVIYNDLSEYLQSSGPYGGRTVKLWLNGYSRGGAVANVLGCMLNDSGITAEENIFVYTFEAPHGVSLYREKADANIYNVILSEDIVTHVVPEKLGLKRAGFDRDVFSADYIEYYREYDPESRPATFKSKRHADGKSLYASVFSGLMQDPYVVGYLTMHDREAYVNNFSVNGKPMLGLVFRFALYAPSRVISRLAEELTGNGKSLVNLIGKIYDDPSALYDKVKPVFDELGFSYGEDLEPCCFALQQLIRTVYYSGAYSPLDDVADVIDNVDYIYMMHSPETVYLSLKNY